MSEAQSPARFLILAAALAVASLLIAPGLLFVAVAIGQWNCGLMALQSHIGAVVAAMGFTIAMAGWRNLQPASERWSRRLFALPWLFAGMHIAGVIFLAPDCPFPSR